MDVDLNSRINQLGLNDIMKLYMKQQQKYTLSLNAHGIFIKITTFFDIKTSKNSIIFLLTHVISLH